MGGRSNHLGWVLLAGLLPMANARGQFWQVFDMANSGFPSNTVVDIVVEANGDAWVATDWGLCRREAGEWSVLQTSNSGLPDNYLRSLALDHDGRLWVGTSLAGVAVYDGQDWVVYDTQNSPLPDDQVNTIHVDHQGWVWLGTVGGLACFTGTEWRLYDSSPASFNGRILNGDHVLDIDTRSDGLVVLGMLNGGFHFLTDTSVQYFTTFNSGFFDNTQRAVLLDTVANERWLACPAGGLVRQIGDWYGGTWFQYTSLNSDLPSNALMDVERDGSGRLWLAGQVSGLIRRDPNDAYASYLTSNSGIPGNELNCVTVAPDGSIWVGTFIGGAGRLDVSTGIGSAGPSNLSISLTPVPNDGHFRVDAPSHSRVVRWEVIEPQGRNLRSGATAHLNGLEVNLGECAPGLYFFRADVDGSTIILRFVVH
ncbi:MAG: hypothetical protein IPM46_04795 [Flavobacteriales bacterium]|nr:hypothetical protein [Flavobacteriales bacterium]